MEIISIMEELTQEGVEVLEELFKENVKPLIERREKVEKKIGNKAIDELYDLEREV